MTNKQFYPISGEFYDDNSSNNTNLLKLDTYTETDDLININKCTSSGFVAGEEDFELFPDPTTAWITIPRRVCSGTRIMSCQPHPPRVVAEFSEYGLDVLDPSSISPSLLNDVSLNREVQMATNLTQGDLHGLYANHTSSSDTNDNVVYNIQNTAHTPELWQDIHGSLITTKTEPVFCIEDDYIFQIDKADLAQEPTLAELNQETLLEDLNVEDLVPTNQETYLIGEQSIPSPTSKYVSILSAESSEGAGPPQQLLQQSHLVHHHAAQQNQQPQAPHRKSLHFDYNAQNTSNSHPKYGLHNMLSYEDRHHKQSVCSTSPYAIYSSTPKKSSMHQSLAFSPGSQGSPHSHYPPTPIANFQTDVSAAHYHQKIAPNPIKSEYTPNSSSYLGQSVPGPSNSHMLLSGTALSSDSSGFGSAERPSYGYHSGNVSRLSTSAPTHLGMDQIWQRREPRQHLLSSGSLTEAESISSITTGILSPEGNEFSQDEGYSDYDSDHYEDFSSDNGSDNEEEDSQTAGANRSANDNKMKERFFWQYNVQSKGPKGQRLVIKSQLEDPHVLNEITDPVFSPNCSVRGIKHSGKARKGDGNDLTPNPRKLYNIGKELDKLGRTINDMTPVSELPFNVRPKSRKEKNKLASRACRLKKKAQHEANKIKLFGLELEHKKLINGLNEIKRTLALKYVNQGQNPADVNNTIELVAEQATNSIRIAGGTTDFVNKVIENVKNGVTTGGLDELRNT